MSEPLYSGDLRPLHIQIHEMLTSRLARGEWAPGEPLPSELALAAEYNVSVGTLRKALDAMVAEGLIVRRRGKGTFVRSHSPDSALEHFFRVVCEDGTKIFPDDDVLSQERIQPNRRERLFFGLSAQEAIFRVNRVRRIQGRAVLTDTLSVPERLFAGFDWCSSSHIFQAPYQYYERKFAIRVIKVMEFLSGALACRSDAKILGIEPGAPVLVIERQAFTFNDVPAELRISRVDTSKHKYLAQVVGLSAFGEKHD